MTQQAAPTPALDFLKLDRDAAVERLSDYLSIPSVSTDPAYQAGITEAAEWTAQQLGEVGLQASILPTQGHPVVFAQSNPQPNKPTVLFYGHYDVQPPDPIELWKTGPFEPTLRDGKLFARGASDDKGQVMCFIEALRAWHETLGEPPCNVKVLIEGEEECGSENLPPFIEKNKDLLAADVCLVSDTAMWEQADGSYVPSICYALRGLLYFDVKLHGPNRDLHSGVYGGSLANPCTILTRVLGNLFDEHHRVTVPGFYDDVRPLETWERNAWEQLGFSEEHFLGGVGVNTPYGEADYSTLERRWARPSCDVNGIYGGYMGEGAKTVIPSFAGGKVSFRLAADQDPHQIADAFRAWLQAQNVHGCTWEITQHGYAYPVAVATDSPWMDAASRAIEHVAGTKPRLIREGATIPVVGDFKRTLGLDTLLVGFGRHDDALHSPNEKFDLDHFHLGCETHAAILAEIARTHGG